MSMNILWNFFLIVNKWKKKVFFFAFFLNEELKEEDDLNYAMLNF